MYLCTIALTNSQNVEPFIKGMIRSTFKMDPEAVLKLRSWQSSPKSSWIWYVYLRIIRLSQLLLINVVTINQIFFTVYLVFHCGVDISSGHELQCDVQMLKSICGLHLARFVLWPEAYSYN